VNSAAAAALSMKWGCISTTLEVRPLIFVSVSVAARPSCPIASSVISDKNESCRVPSRWSHCFCSVRPVRRDRNIKEARSMKPANTARDDRINTRIFLPNIPETSLLHGGASVLIEIKSAALASRYAGKRWINFFRRVGKKN
jgi:hypothetical protein